MRTRMTDTSLDAFDDLRHSPKIQAQQKLILDAMNDGKTYTRHELANITGLETSTVSARINAMLGILVDIQGKRRCSVTGRTVQELVKL